MLKWYYHLTCNDKKLMEFYLERTLHIRRIGNTVYCKWRGEILSDKRRWKWIEPEVRYLQKVWCQDLHKKLEPKLWDGSVRMLRPAQQGLCCNAGARFRRWVGYLLKWSGGRLVVKRLPLQNVRLKNECLRHLKDASLKSEEGAGKMYECHTFDLHAFKFVPLEILAVHMAVVYKETNKGLWGASEWRWTPEVMLILCETDRALDISAKTIVWGEWDSTVMLHPNIAAV